ncbi:MAG: FkbM family methyltransferase [Planctomycetota bacterium]
MTTGARAQRKRRRGLHNAIGDRLADRKRFGSTLSWLKFCYHRLCVRWNLPGSRKPTTVRFAGHGAPVHLRRGTVDFIIWEHLFERGEYSNARAALGEGVRNILDLGANVGVSVRLWRQWWPKATVVACEPDRTNFALAERNIIEIKPTPNVHLVQAAAVGNARRVSLRRGGLDDSSFEITDDGPSDVEGMTVPQLLESAGIEGEIDLLKCDIEGAEEELFADCRDWIGCVRAIVVEIHNAYTQDRLEADLSRNGWKGSAEILHDFDGGRVLLLQRAG